MNPLVSIMIPCYNCEKTVSKLLESILNQTYKTLQVIIVNDGSTDSTEEVIKKYERNFKDGNIIFEYLYQENSGQAAAIQQAIKQVKGKYIMWADSDDYYEKNAVKLMLDYMEEYPDVAIVRGNAIYREERTFNKIKIAKPNENTIYKNLFEEYLLSDDIYIYVGAYMARFSEYKKANPNLRIYCGREGQNYQLLLPVLFHNKVGYIDENIYNFVIRNGSHSRRYRNKQKLYDRYDGIRDICLETIKIINNMNLEEFNYYSKMINDKYDKKILDVAFEYGDRKVYKEKYDKIMGYNINVKYYKDRHEKIYKSFIKYNMLLIKLFSKRSIYIIKIKLGRLKRWLLKL